MYRSTELEVNKEFHRYILLGLGELTFLFQSSTKIVVSDHHQYG